MRTYQSVTALGLCILTYTTVCTHMQQSPGTYGYSESMRGANVLPRCDVDIYRAAGGTMDRNTAAKPGTLVDTHRVYGSVLDPQSYYRISGPHGPLMEQEQASATANIALALAVTCDKHKINSNWNTENNFISQFIVSLSQYPMYSHANMTASGLLSSYGLGPSGFLVPVGPGPSTTWCTTTHPVQREVTSSFLSLGVISPSPSCSTNLFIDAEMTFAVVHHCRCTTTGCRLLRQLDLRFRCRRTRLPVRLLLRRTRLRHRLSRTVVMWSLILHRSRWVLLLWLRHHRLLLLLPV